MKHEAVRYIGSLSTSTTSLLQKNSENCSRTALSAGKVASTAANRITLKKFSKNIQLELRINKCYPNMLLLRAYIGPSSSSYSSSLHHSTLNITKAHWALIASHGIVNGESPRDLYCRRWGARSTVTLERSTLNPHVSWIPAISDVLSDSSGHNGMIHSPR